MSEVSDLDLYKELQLSNNNKREGLLDKLITKADKLLDEDNIKPRELEVVLNSTTTLLKDQETSIRDRIKTTIKDDENQTNNEIGKAITESLKNVKPLKNQNTEEIDQKLEADIKSDSINDYELRTDHEDLS